jgi:hypothetical protein
VLQRMSDAQKLMSHAQSNGVGSDHRDVRQVIIARHRPSARSLLNGQVIDQRLTFVGEAFDGLFVSPGFDESVERGRGPSRFP